MSEPANPSSDPATPSTESRILAAVRLTLANVIKDTATPHGMQHPLSDGTIEDLRQCLALISARERELAQSASDAVPGAATARPRFSDEAPAREPVEKVIRLHPRKTDRDDP